VPDQEYDMVSACTAGACAATTKPTIAPNIAIFAEFSNYRAFHRIGIAGQGAVAAQKSRANCAQAQIISIRIVSRRLPVRSSVIHQRKNSVGVVNLDFVSDQPDFLRGTGGRSFERIAILSPRAQAPRRTWRHQACACRLSSKPAPTSRARPLVASRPKRPAAGGEARSARS
jgi:hypothetical protein